MNLQIDWFQFPKNGSTGGEAFKKIIALAECDEIIRENYTELLGYYVSRWMAVDDRYGIRYFPSAIWRPLPRLQRV